MAEDGTGRGLTRAVTAPVRAVTAPVRAVGRMLGGAPGARATQETKVAAVEADAIVDCGLYLDGVRHPEPMHYADALAAAREHANGFVWLGLLEPTERQLDGIAETFGLHELAVEDAVKSAQRPKVERYGEMTFCALRTARYIEHEELTETSEVVEVGDILMFIGADYIITVRHGDAARLAPVRAQLEDRVELLSHGPWAVAYAVYDLVVDAYLDVVAEVEDDVAAVEEVVFARQSSKHSRIQRIYQLKRELMEFKRAVLPLQRPVSALVSGAVARVPDEVRRYLRDVLDHLNRAVEQVVYFDDVLNSILQARLAQVSVDQNNDMRKIAAWAGIAAVWTSVAGVYGMNFEFLPGAGWRYGYHAIVAVMAVISALLYRAFRRSGWL